MAMLAAGHRSGLTFKTRRDNLRTYFVANFDTHEFTEAILSITTDHRVRKHAQTMVDVGCLAENLEKLQEAYDANPSHRPHLSNVLSMVASAFYIPVADRAPSSNYVTSKLCHLAAACGIKEDRMQKAFEEFFNPKTAVDRSGTRNQHRFQVVEYMEGHLQPSPDKNTVARKRVAKNQWVTHAIYYRNRTWLRLYAAFLMHCRIRPQDMSYWVRNEPPLMCQHYMDLMMKLALKEYIRLHAEVHAEALHDVVKRSIAFQDVKHQALYCTHCADNHLLAEPMPTPSENPPFKWNGVYQRFGHIVVEDFMKSMLCHTALGGGTDTTLECIYGGCSFCGWKKLAGSGCALEANDTVVRQLMYYELYHYDTKPKKEKGRTGAFVRDKNNNLKMEKKKRHTDTTTINNITTSTTSTTSTTTATTMTTTTTTTTTTAVVFLFFVVAETQTRCCSCLAASSFFLCSSGGSRGHRAGRWRCSWKNFRSILCSQTILF
jgi:hypothetical protein